LPEAPAPTTLAVLTPAEEPQEPPAQPKPDASGEPAAAPKADCRACRARQADAASAEDLVRAAPRFLPPGPPREERAADPADPKLPTELLGTTVEFVNNPDEAAQAAAREDKLLFMLHVSGNFEDPQFT
jgi:hypothetical protein